RCVEPWCDRIGEAQHFQCARPVWQPANEAALLERRDQPVDAGFRREVERILHLVEGGRDTGFLQPFMDEEKQFVLLARQHLSLVAVTGNRRQTKPEQTLSVPVLFRNHLIFRETVSGLFTVSSARGKDRK